MDDAYPLRCINISFWSSTMLNERFATIPSYYTYGRNKDGHPIATVQPSIPRPYTVTRYICMMVVNWGLPQGGIIGGSLSSHCTVALRLVGWLLYFCGTNWVLTECFCHKMNTCGWPQKSHHKIKTYYRDDKHPTAVQWHHEVMWKDKQSEPTRLEMRNGWPLVFDVHSPLMFRR